MRQAIYTRLYHILLLLIAVTLPFTKNINSYCIVLLALNWVVEGRFKEKWQRLARNRLLWLFLAFFLLHLLSVLYSTHWQDALKLVERKLALFVFPIVLCSMPIPPARAGKHSSSPYGAVPGRRAKGGVLPAGQSHQILLAFAASVTVGALYCLLSHCWHWLSSGNMPDFFYHALSKPIGMSAIYYSCYTCFSIFIFVFYLKENRPGVSYILRSLIISTILFLTGFLILLSSKIFLIIFILCGNLFLLFFIFKRQRVKKATISIITFTLLIIMAAITIPEIQTRFRNIYNSNFAVLKQEQFRYDTPFSGLTLRLVFWQTAARILQQQNAWIAGVGIGDAEPLLNGQYRQRNLYLGNSSLGETGYLNYNTHNQYVQVMLELGVIGLLLWLAYLFVPLWVTWQSRNGLWLLFLLMMTIFALTEVYLATHKGVVFFVFFQSLFSFTYKKSPQAE